MVSSRLIAGCATNVRAKAGEHLFKEGEGADVFYVIRHGAGFTRYEHEAHGVAARLSFVHGGVEDGISVVGQRDVGALEQLGACVVDPEPAPYLAACLDWMGSDGHDWKGPLHVQPSEVSLFIGESTTGQPAFATVGSCPSRSHISSAV